MKRGVIIIIVLLGLSLIQLQPPHQDKIQGLQEQFKESQLDDDPITIENNTQFEIQGWPGNGTSTNPYLIEDQRIQAVDDYYGQTGIRIYYTDVFFVIRNCTIVSPDRSGYVIRFYNVSNARVENCNITVEDGIGPPASSLYGVYASRATNVHVMNCNINGGTRGITLHNSVDCSIEYNEVNDQREYGITVVYSNNTVVHGNTAIGMESGFSHSGISVYGQVMNCTVASNNVSNFLLSGIRFSHTIDLLIQENTVTNTRTGFLVTDTNQSYILSNTITNNHGGMLLESNSHHNTISHNIFGDNEENAEDRGYNNTWSSNWYSDYGGIGIYVISGTSRSIDTSPQPTTLHIPKFINNIIILSLISLIPLGAAIGYHIRYRETDEEELRIRPSLFFLVLTILLPCGISISQTPDSSLPNLRYFVTDVLFTLGATRNPGSEWVVSFYSSSVITQNDHLLLVTLPYLVCSLLSIILLMGYLRKDISRKRLGSGFFVTIIVVMLLPLFVSVLLFPITPLLALSIVFWAHKLRFAPKEIDETLNP